MKKNKLIIDIGSGHNPATEADILLDKISCSNEHRWGKSLKIDRPIILYKGDKFPIANKAFDFSICKHVLEHVNKPAVFLNELVRISKSGYIETPSETSELIFTPYEKHRLIISKEKDKLTIRKKLESNTPKHGSLIDVMFSLDKKLEMQFYDKHRKLFLVEYFWNNNINYQISEQASLKKEETYPNDYWKSLLDKNPLKSEINKFLKNVFYNLIRKFTKYDLEEILMCTSCGSQVKRNAKTYNCVQCSKKYSIKNNIIYCD